MLTHHQRLLCSTSEDETNRVSALFPARAFAVASVWGLFRAQAIVDFAAASVSGLFPAQAVVDFAAASVSEYPAQGLLQRAAQKQVSTTL